MRVSVRHDAVADTAARLALTVKAFEYELDILDSEVERLRSAWDGEAQRAYDRAQRERQFDDAVNTGTPARGQMNGEDILVTRVDSKDVP